MFLVRETIDVNPYSIVDNSNRVLNSEVIGIILRTRRQIYYLGHIGNIGLRKNNYHLLYFFIQNAVFNIMSLMKIVSIVSPDKLSISAFLSFMRFCLGRGYVIGDLHSLMSNESLELYVDSLMAKRDRIIFSYYAKKQIDVDPKTVVPAKLMTVSDIVVWINMYSTEWVVMKDTGNQAGQYQERWKKNMGRMSVTV